MSTPLRELRDRRVAPLSKKGGHHDDDIATERASKPAAAAKSARSAAYRRSTWAAIDARNPAEPAIAIGTAFDESTIFDGYGATQATRITSAASEVGWRVDLAAQLINERRRPRAPLSREKAIERLEWQLEELLLHDKRRITRAQLMTLVSALPITIEDAAYLSTGGTRTDRVLDRCFELMGEERKDGIHNERAIRRA
jgi:hypothetical protein